MLILSKIRSVASGAWGYLAAAGAAVAAIFIAYQKGRKGKEYEQRAMNEAAAREYERAGSEALVGGLENERKIADEKIDPTNRDHFS